MSNPIHQILGQHYLREMTTDQAEAALNAYVEERERLARLDEVAMLEYNDWGEDLEYLIAPLVDQFIEDRSKELEEKKQ